MSEKPCSHFLCHLHKFEIWWATVTYSLQDSASTTTIVEVTVAICLKSLMYQYAFFSQDNPVMINPN